MNGIYSRRQVLKDGLASLSCIALFGLAGCNDAPSSIASATELELQMTFWGSVTRDQLTRQAITLFHKSHPTVTISTHISGFDTYWKLLDTDIAQGNVPDLIQMDMRYLSQYVREGVLLDLTELVYNQTIDLSDFDPLLLNSSKANNTIYGVPLGGNYQSMYYDQFMVEKARIGILSPGFTWDTFAAYTTELSKALGNGIYGTSDNSRDITTFEVWIRQRNKELYDHNGNISFDLEDVSDWYSYWNNLRKAGGCPPMKLQAGLDNSGTPADSSLIKGITVFFSYWSNTYEAWQKATPHLLQLVSLPTGPAPGMYLKASQMLSISSKSANATEAASFISFIINNAEAVKTLGIERGEPGSLQGLALLTPQFTPTQQRMDTYMNLVSQNGVTRPKKVLDPPGAGRISDLLKQTAQAIGLGQTSVTEGAKAFYIAARKAVTSS